MLNPWKRLPASPPYVLLEDRPFVDAWNQIRAAHKPRVRLRLGVLPEPFVGPRDAPLVILGRNPGWSGTEPRDQVGALGKALRGNLTDDARRHVHPWFLDTFTRTDGGQWARKAFLPVSAASRVSFEDLARRVLSVEFHAYHSRDWAPLPVTLPSQ